MSSLDIVYPKEFYSRRTTMVARELLGAIICRQLNDGSIVEARIIETEAYRDNEPACHAFRGPKPRCAVMFGPPGVSYVYFIYGANYCFNVVTEPDGRGCAVLIRAVEGDGMNGPGRLCRKLCISREHNGLDLMEPASGIWIAQGQAISSSQIGVSTRIGVKAAEDLPWRFFIKDHPNLSGAKSFNRRNHFFSASVLHRASELELA